MSSGEMVRYLEVIRPTRTFSVHLLEDGVDESAYLLRLTQRPPSI